MNWTTLCQVSGNSFVKMASDSESEPRWKQLLRDVQASVPDESGPHASRVGVVAEAVYRCWVGKQEGAIEGNVKEETARIIRQAAMLHDVGKRKVPAELLAKSTELSAQEFAIIRTHTTAGAAYFDNPADAVEAMAQDVCLRHHERWDGKGYPGRHWEMRDGGLYPTLGLVGDDIPFAARVVALADVYDALLSARVYKEPWPESQVLEHIRSERGAHFDPDLVDVFLEHYDEIRSARETLI